MINKSPKFKVGDLVTAKGIKNTIYKITEIITYYKLNRKIAFYIYKAKAKNEFAEYKMIEFSEKYLKKYKESNNESNIYRK